MSFGVLLLLMAAAAFVVMVGKASRRTRRAGPRQLRMPFMLLGVVSMFLVPAGFVVALATGNFERASDLRLYLFLVPTIMLSSVFLRSALRQEKAKEGAGVVIERGAVVYMRGFLHENNRFAYTSMKHEDNQRIGITYNPDRFRRGTATFEEFLEPKVRELIGRWQGLGDPTDRLPPLGGDRVYTPDEEWQKAFTYLVEHSRCVITFAHSYAQLRYELSVVRKAGVHQRFFVLTPPLRDFILRQNAAEHRKAWETCWARVAAEAAQPHENFAVPGFTLGPYPGPGAVVTFDVDATAVVLRTDARTPLDFVSAMRAHLDALAVEPAP